MNYHQLASKIDTVPLEELHAQRAGDWMQWHREDYTLVFRAQYVELASMSEARAEEDRDSILAEAEVAWVGESTVEEITTFFGFHELEAVDRRPFADEATDLVELFVDAVVTMPDDLNTPEHRTLVTNFAVALEDFLTAYKALSLEDVARYVSKVGISEEKAQNDLELVLGLYD